MSAVILFSAFSTACGWLCSSKGSNVSSSLDAPVVAVAAPRDMSHDRPANWTAAWESGHGPFTIEWDFGGGAENIGPLAADSPDHRSPVMINEDQQHPVVYSYTVTVQDSNGESGYASGQYEVAPYLNTPPELSLTFDGRLLIAEVFDADGDDLAVALSTEGLTGEPESQTVAGGSGSAEFFIYGDSLFAAASGTATVTVEDGRGGVVTDSIEVDIPAVELADNVAYVIPLRNRAAVGEQVRFLCFTGLLDNPFRNVNSVSVIIEDDAEYVQGSFNVGALGGGMANPDGIWPNVGVSEFIIAENLIVGVEPRADFDIPQGHKRWSFNVTGLGGNDLMGGQGALFNFAMTFSRPGEKHVGMQKFDVVKRTYYGDGANNEYFWGALMADAEGNLLVQGVDNTILVE